MSARLKVGAIAALTWVVAGYGDSPFPASASASQNDSPATIPSDADAWRRVAYRSRPAPPTKVAPVPDLQAFAPQKLPVYLVIGSHVLVDRGNNLATDKGRIAQAFREHPGLVVGNIFGLNAAQAPEMIRTEDWAAAKSDYEDLAHDLALGGDAGEGRFVVKAVQNADLEVRAQDEKDLLPQVGGQFQVGHIQANSRLLQGPDQPIDFPVVQMKW